MSTAPPRLVVVTDRHGAASRGRTVAAVVADAVDAGAPAVLLRDKDLPTAERIALGEQIRPLVAEAGATLLVSSDPDLARHLDADGLHLAAADPPCRDVIGILGRSCHDLAEVVSAQREGVGYVFVSPVAPTPSKPGHGPALGPTGLGALVTAADPVPVLALGGVTPGNAADWRVAGAHGIAVMGGVMAAADPGAAVRALLAAWERAATTPPSHHVTELP